MESNFRMIVDNDLKTMWTKTVVAHLKYSYKILSDTKVSGSRIETDKYKSIKLKYFCA
jgi:hypothetical protein